MNNEQTTKVCGTLYSHVNSDCKDFVLSYTLKRILGRMFVTKRIHLCGYLLIVLHAQNNLEVATRR